MSPAFPSSSESSTISPPRFFSTFIRSATSPSFAALLGIILVAGAWLACGMCCVTPKTLARMNPAVMMVDDTDEDAKLTIDALRIAAQPAPQKSVIVIGDSAIREAVTSEHDLADRISRKTGADIQVHLLVAGSLNLWDSYRIADCIRQKADGLVVIEMSPHAIGGGISMLTRRLDAQRFALESPAVLEEANRAHLPLPRRFNNYFLDNYWFFLPRPEVLWHLVAGPIQTRDHFDIAEPMDNAKARATVAHFEQWTANYMENRGMNLQAYGRMVRLLRTRPGVSVALLETVYNPMVQSIDPRNRDGLIWQTYQSDARVFANRVHAPFWDLNHVAMLRPHDFGDFSHVRSDDARERYTEALACKSAALLIEQKQQPGQSP